MNTTEAKRVINLERRKSMWGAAHNIGKDEEMCFEARVMAQDVKELLNERREMVETIRKQRILLAEAEGVLVAVSQGYAVLKDKLHEAVMGDG